MSYICIYLHTISNVIYLNLAIQIYAIQLLQNVDRLQHSISC